jgi:hypothetical protein
VTHFASPSFWEAYAKLPENIRALADKDYALLKENPRYPSLQLKKVDRFWLVSVGSLYRALAVEVDAGLLWFWIGSQRTMMLSSDRVGEGAACAENSDSGILVVQSAKDQMRYDASRAMTGRETGESLFGLQDTRRMRLAKRDDMVGALAADGSDHPFDDAVLTKETWARWACHGCPLFVVGASRRCRRPDLDRGSCNAELHSSEMPPRDDAPSKF